jgi:hypothetical protein
MFNTIVGVGAVGGGAASPYGSGSDQMMRLLLAPAPQHWFEVLNSYRYCTYFYPRVLIVLLSLFNFFLKYRSKRNVSNIGNTFKELRLLYIFADITYRYRYFTGIGTGTT